MKLHKRKILITKDKSVDLYEQTLFKANGEEGLHLWESSVVFSRLICKIPNLFDNKEIIELGSGCGLLGLVCLMFTKCKHVAFSDYHDTILTNLIKNISLNKQNHNHLIELKPEDNNQNNANIDITNYPNNTNPTLYTNCTGCIPGRFSLLKLDWRDYEKYKYESYDIVIGSELIYSGGHIEELAKLIYNLLKKGGKAYITMPEKRSKTKDFLQYLSENNLECAHKFIEEESEDIFDKILEDEKESKKLFENLKGMKIILYEITKN